MNDIFLSYAKEDKDYARNIAQTLEKEGYDVWWDVEIPIGETFDDVIEKAIVDTKCVVVLWSRHSIDSEWVKVEAAEGKKRNILIPVRIDDVEIPLAFRRRQTANLIHWNNKITHPDFIRLLKDIELIISNKATTEVKSYGRIKSKKSKTGNLKKGLKKGLLLTIVIVGILSVVIIFNNIGSSNEDPGIILEPNPSGLNDARLYEQGWTKLENSTNIEEIVKFYIKIRGNNIKARLRSETTIIEDSLKEVVYGRIRELFNEEAIIYMKSLTLFKGKSVRSSDRFTRGDILYCDLEGTRFLIDEFNRKPLYQYDDFTPTTHLILVTEVKKDFVRVKMTSQTIGFD